MNGTANFIEIRKIGNREKELPVKKKKNKNQISNFFLLAFSIP
jgi:hypothetical protein